VGLSQLCPQCWDNSHARATVLSVYANYCLWSQRHNIRFSCLRKRLSSSSTSMGLYTRDRWRAASPTNTGRAKYRLRTKVQRPEETSVVRCWSAESSTTCVVIEVRDIHSGPIAGVMGTAEATTDAWYLKRPLPHEIQECLGRAGPQRCLIRYCLHAKP
jgi:hypothetical protein